MPLLIAFLAFALTSDLAQTSAVQGAQIIDKAIQAHGGLAALQSIHVISREFAVVQTDPAQGKRPETPAKNTNKLTSIRDLQRQRIVEIVDTAPDTTYNHIALMADGGFAWNRPLNSSLKVPPPALPGLRARFMRRHPESLLLAAVARPDALRYLGDESFEGRAQHVVTYADTDGTALTLSFDAQTGLLTKVETVVDDAVRGDVSSELVYRDYSDENGVKLPHRYVESLGGQVTQDSKTTSIRINGELPDTLFTIPDGYPPLVQTPPAQGALKMADNIYVMQSNYNTMFAVFPDYVVVLEGPFSNATSDAVLREIKKAAPGKPVKYVVVTHFHFDHISGIRRWVAEGATIVCPPTAKQAIERAVAASHKLHPDDLARSPKAPVFELVQGKTRVFEGGGLKLEVRDVSPSPHVDEMLVGYFPDAHILYEADAFSITTGLKIVVREDGVDLGKKIADWQIEKVVPVHGRVGTMNEVKEAIAAARAN